MSKDISMRLVYNNVPAIQAAMPGRVRAVIEKTLKDIDETVKESMREEKSGSTYVRGGKVHIASAPGEPPAIDTGMLVNSLFYRMQSDRLGIYGTNELHGLILEFGGRKMAPRPWLKPALDANRDAFERALEGLL